MNDMPEFTPRNVTKFVVQATVQYKATKLTRTALIEHTALESDNPVVKIGSGVVGWGVATKLKPHTDRMVDKTADFVNEKRENRRIKKQKKNDNQ